MCGNGGTMRVKESGAGIDNHKGCDVNGGGVARCRVDTAYFLSLSHKGRGNMQYPPCTPYLALLVSPRTLVSRTPHLVLFVVVYFCTTPSFIIWAGKPRPYIPHDSPILVLLFRSPLCLCGEYFLQKNGATQWIAPIKRNPSL